MLLRRRIDPSFRGSDHRAIGQSCRCTTEYISFTNHKDIVLSHSLDSLTSVSLDAQVFDLTMNKDIVEPHRPCSRWLASLFIYGRLQPFVRFPFCPEPSLIPYTRLPTTFLTISRLAGREKKSSRQGKGSASGL